ncbi:MAG: formate dehydrogenase accessory sulfurtransferase FdhD [Microbacteriaceae bacterium]|nr:formate dehydrogenase accessory sulfurtransferase FdhD [Microbacteriaceae bacterium]
MSEVVLVSGAGLAAVRSEAVTRYRRDDSGVFSAREDDDPIAVEDPLEIRIDGQSWSITMRTPGEDLDLVAGFLVGEGVITSPEHLASLGHVANALNGNTVNAQLTAGATPPADAAARHAVTTSACGICGTESIDAIEKQARWSLESDEVRVDAAVLAALPDRLRAAQTLFDATGGVHAAGLFTAAGEPLCVREDVGRHNAVDKVVGWALRQDLLPLRGTVLQVSGRASFELVQKARLAGIPVLAAVGAPSSLSRDLADSAGLTLVGFSRGRTFSVYTHSRRVAVSA